MVSYDYESLWLAILKLLVRFYEINKNIELDGIDWNDHVDFSTNRIHGVSKHIIKLWNSDKLFQI